MHACRSHNKSDFAAEAHGGPIPDTPSHFAALVSKASTPTHPRHTRDTNGTAERDTRDCMIQYNISLQQLHDSTFHGQTQARPAHGKMLDHGAKTSPRLRAPEQTANAINENAPRRVRFHRSRYRGQKRAKHAARVRLPPPHAAVVVRVGSVLGMTLGMYASLSAGLSQVTSLVTVCQ